MSPILDVLLDVSLRAVALAAGVRAVLVITDSPAVRHAAWAAVAATMLSLPVLQSWIPALPVPIPLAAGGVMAAVSVSRGDEPPVPVTATAVPDYGRSADVVPPAGARDGRAVSRSAVSWADLAAGVYLAGVALMLARLAIGWGMTRRLVARALRVRPGVHESRDVATPLLVGVLWPRTLLPIEWRMWPADTLAAVLLHEQAHVARRDPLIAGLARVNRCVFWFHPLAWWLPGALAAAAEDACDDRVCRALGAPRYYAGVLLDIAEAARQHGGRFARHGIGVDGAGALGRRIDRILHRRPARGTSLPARAAVATGCSAAIVLAIACRGQAPPLREDPQVAAQIADQKARDELVRAARGMHPSDAAALEAALEGAPDNVEARRKLLAYYRMSGNAPDDAAASSARRHLLWLIEHRPDDYATLSNLRLAAEAHDPEGYTRAKEILLANAKRPDVTAAALRTAAVFLDDTDKPLAEAMLLRARQIDPDARTLPQQAGGGARYWSAQLGRLYARAIAGSIDDMRGWTSEEAASPFALEARRKLDVSKDAAMLAAAGVELTTGSGRDRGGDISRLGRSYLERAVEADRDQPVARAALSRLDEQASRQAVQERIRSIAITRAPASLAQRIQSGAQLTPAEASSLTGLELRALDELPESERFVEQARRADERYMMAESLQSRGDQAGADAAWSQSKTLARNALTLALKLRDDPRYGLVVYRASVALAAHALREGDRRAAVRLMLEASEAPASEALRHHLFGLDQRLVNYLLKAGEREPVALFLERSAALRPAERDHLLKDAAAVRGGVMPLAYQYQVARGQM